MSEFIYRFTPDSEPVSFSMGTNDTSGMYITRTDGVCMAVNDTAGVYIMLTDGSVHLIPRPGAPTPMPVCTETGGVLGRRKLVRGDSIASPHLHPRTGSALGAAARAFQRRAVRRYPLCPNPVPPAILDSGIVDGPVYLHEIHYSE